jgi:copper chaperone
MNAETIRTTTTFTVEGMSCDHCVAAVTDALSRLENVRDVAVDLATGAVTVESNGAVDPELVAAAVDEAGYKVLR